MLQRIHENIKGWFAFLIFGLITVSFLIWGIMYYIEAMQKSSSMLAKVNGIKISDDQFNQAYQNAQKNVIQQQGGVLSDAQQAQLKQVVLNQLITRAVLSTEAKKLGFYVSRAEVNALVTQMPVFQVNGNFSPERFEQVLYSNGLTPEKFTEDLRYGLLINQVQFGLAKSNFLLPNELNKTYVLLNQQRDFGYFIISPKQFEQEIPVTQSAVETFYQQNRPQFQVPPQASFKYVLLSQNALAKQVNVSEGEIQQYYQDNKQNYRTPIKWQVQMLTISAPEGSTEQQQKKAQTIAQGIVNQLQNGVPFDHLAKTYGAKTLWVEQGQVSDLFANVLSQMRSGQISRPFQTRAGLTMVKLLAVQPGKLKSFASVKKEIQTSLKDQKVQNLLSQKSEDLSNLTYTNPDSLKPVADSLGLQIETTPMATQSGLKTGILSDQDVLSTAFTPSVLTEGNNSNPIALKNGDLVVLRVNQYVPAHVPALNKIEDQVKAQYVQQMATAKAKAQAVLIQKNLQQNSNPEALAKQYHLVWHYQTKVISSEKNIPTPILALAFHLPPVANNQTLSSAAIVLDNGDLAVVGLKKIQLAKTSSLNSKEAAALQGKLADYYGTLDYAFYQHEAMDNADIKKNSLPAAMTN